MGGRGLWRNPENQDGGPRSPPLTIDHIIPTPGDVISPFCRRQRKQFSAYYFPLRPIAIGLMMSVVVGGDYNSPPPPRLRDEKKSKAKRG